MELVDDIEKRQVFGFATARIHVIEFRNRELPHCHMLIWVEKRDAPVSPEDVDGNICVEIPDKASNPRLYTIGMSHMIHGPCGLTNNKSTCMRQKAQNPFRNHSARRPPSKTTVIQPTEEEIPA